MSLPEFEMRDTVPVTIYTNLRCNTLRTMNRRLVSSLYDFRKIVVPYMTRR